MNRAIIITFCHNYTVGVYLKYYYGMGIIVYSDDIAYAYLGYIIVFFCGKITKRRVTKLKGESSATSSLKIAVLGENSVAVIAPVFICPRSSLGILRFK